MKVIHKPGASEKLRIAIKNLGDKSLRVGWFDTAVYEDGTPVAYVATIQEFGYPAGGIPARPFMRPTVADKTAEWRSTLAAGARQVMNGKLTVDQMLGQFGFLAAGNIAETIRNTYTPALAQSTIYARQRKRRTAGVSTKPLIDTGLMIQSVDFKVEG